jgi:hypothetical protein
MAINPARAIAAPDEILTDTGAEFCDPTMDFPRQRKRRRAPISRQH